MKRIAKIVGVDARRPARETITRAATLIRQGGVVVFPTASLYGLGADAFNVHAVGRIVRLKERDPNKPILVLVDSPRMMARVARSVNPMAHYLIGRLWPGRVTFVVQAGEGVPLGLTGGSGKIGVRQVAHPVAAALVKALDSPLSGTSANLSGAGGCAAIDKLDPAVLNSVDLVLDAGPLAGGTGSTVVDVTGLTPVVLREGAVPEKEILTLFHRFAAKNIDKKN